MKLSIVDRNKCLTSQLRILARRRLLFALSRFDSKIEEVTLSIRDLNGPKGGIDKRCQLRIKLRFGDDIILTNLDSTVEASVSRLGGPGGQDDCSSYQPTSGFVSSPTIRKRGREIRQ